MGREVAGFDVDRLALAGTPLTRVLADDEALAPTHKTRFVRTSWQIVHRGSRIEVALDEGKVKSGRAERPYASSSWS
jgi:inorganic triphosphatase YgiF